ncbi:DUF805 domain-containing protein [Pedobacter nutrimenti]|nr:DUF805 domain-containing protein [Pedobacter nutrimenti]
MFKNPFSFEGRIRRLEYWLSFLCYMLYSIVVGIIIGMLSYMQIIPPMDDDKMDGVLFIAALPVFYFIIAQTAKRCHDRGDSGWWMIVPLYGFWMLFADGDIGDNEYGPNPKGLYYEFEDHNSPSPIDQVDGDGRII